MESKILQNQKENTNVDSKEDTSDNKMEDTEEVESKQAHLFENIYIKSVFKEGGLLYVCKDSSSPKYSN